MGLFGLKVRSHNQSGINPGVLWILLRVNPIKEGLQYFPGVKKGFFGLNIVFFFWGRGLFGNIGG